MKEEEDQNGITVGAKNSRVSVDYINEYNYNNIICTLKKYYESEF